MYNHSDKVCCVYLCREDEISSVDENIVLTVLDIFLNHLKSYRYT